MRQALGIVAGYAVILAMGLFLLAMAVISMWETPPPHTALWIVLVVAFLAGAAGAVASVRYELASNTSKERIRRHRQMQMVSVVALGVGIVAFLTWALVPAPARVALASAFSGFVLGFMAMFIPNRHRALEIRQMDVDE